ncbi:hypothetical protein AS156_01000 [Bradyrhizobium macuxiense]|uniref:Uncharacterized protein n=1 Tax=Bradyrhizobium macuxiense TaxID=1755647 RepID=A0A120FMU5_9BRAD|nr:hypothetical protein [Bradyrhizobium macuxiense]KWV54337.1 hypothetical protein AS156_01000 [Bradyrhizobium macuxiense]
MPTNVQALMLAEVTVSGGPTPSTKTLDGHASSQASTVSSSTVTLSTTHANDILVLHFGAEGTPGAAIAVSSVSSTSGLTWQRRSQIQLGPATMLGHGSNYLTVEVWWAHAPSAVTNEVITVNINHSIDEMTLIAFGVSGCNTAAPWDANVSLPAYNSQASGSSVNLGVTGVSTNSTLPFMIGCTSNASGGQPPPPAGWTNIDIQNNGGGTLVCESRADYDALTFKQSGASFTYGGSAASYALIVDALF